MNLATLQARLNRAAARTGSLIGSPCDIYRPKAPITPLTPPLWPEHRIHRLHAAFFPHTHPNRPAPDTEPYWHAYFDSTHTQPGDIIRRLTDNSIWFIAAHQPGQTTLCIQATHTITLTRPQTPTTAGLNPYSGATQATDTHIATQWPAFITTTKSAGTALATNQSQLQTNTWTTLLPTSLTTIPKPGDKITNTQNQTAIITTTTRTPQTWQISAVQVST
jgi:hypothetical protein